MDFLSIQNVMVTLPPGEDGYALSWIEAIGTVFGLLCIWFASKEKLINYLFGLINVTLFAAIFFQIQLYASLLLQVFFFTANLYGWYAWSRQNEAALKIRWLPRNKAFMLAALCLVAIALMTLFIDPVFAVLTRIAVGIMQSLGVAVEMPQLQPDAFPLWDSAMLILSIAAMVLMTRKYVENWLLWIVIDVISVVIYAIQGVYAMSLEYILLTAIAVMGFLAWIKRARMTGSRPFA
ncbi:nicotinamide riboside transporter PnuC [Salmonella enterica]